MDRTVKEQVSACGAAALCGILTTRSHDDESPPTVILLRGAWVREIGPSGPGDELVEARATSALVEVPCGV